MSEEANLNNDSIYHKQILKSNISIFPKDLTSNNIDEILKQKIIELKEGICVREGFIRRGSINIISRSAGKVNSGSFKGDIIYIVEYEAEICNPQQRQIISCNVLSSNKASINAYVEDKDLSPLEIVMHRQHHIGNSEFVMLKENDKILIEVIYTKYKYLDKKIHIVSKFIKLDN